MMAMTNPFTKEYYNGKKDQFDVDYTIFKKAIGLVVTAEFKDG